MSRFNQFHALVTTDPITRGGIPMSNAIDIPANAAPIWSMARYDEALTQARRYADIETEARNDITVVADVAPSTVDLDVHVAIDDLDATAAQQRITARRAAARTAEREALDDAASAAEELRNAGVSLRDIGVTYQRVGQILDAAS